MTDPVQKIGTCIVTDDAGVPAHVLDLDALQAQGAALAYALAADVDQPEELHLTLLGAIDSISREAFPLVATYALQVFAESILRPALAAAGDDTKADLIAGIRATSDALNHTENDAA